MSTAPTYRIVVSLIGSAAVVALPSGSARAAARPRLASLATTTVELLTSLDDLPVTKP